MLKLLADSAPINLVPQGKDELASKVGGLEFGSIVSGFLQLILIGASIIFFFMLVIGGVQWIMSGGDKAHTESARNRITAALVGLVIVFSAWAIARLVNAFFGVNIFDLTVRTIG